MNFQKLLDNCDEKISSLTCKITTLRCKQLMNILVDGVKIGTETPEIRCYLKQIELVKIEKLVYMAFKVKNYGIFNKLSDKFNSVMLEILELANECVLDNSIEEQDYIFLCNISVDETAFIKNLCEAGSDRMNIFREEGYYVMRKDE